MRNALIASICLLSLCASPRLSYSNDMATEQRPTGVSGAILSSLGSTNRTESFLLAPELNFLNRSTPRIHSWPIVARGRDLDSTQAAVLRSILEKATPDHDVVPPEHCGFDPSFGLRFHGGGGPLDMLISSDYSRWCFLHGETGGGVYCPETPALRDSMKALIGELFPNLGRDGGIQ